MKTRTIVAFEIALVLLVLAYGIALRQYGQHVDFIPDPYRLPLLFAAQFVLGLLLARYFGFWDRTVPWSERAIPIFSSLAMVPVGMMAYFFFGCLALARCS